MLLNDIEQKVEVFEKYFETVNFKGECFFDSIWIRSNKFYVFLGEKDRYGKTFAMFSKKYFLTIELTQNEKYNKVLDFIGEITDKFRTNRYLVVEKYSFWLPHCLVNNNEVKAQLVAESFGVSRELALDYLIHYDKVFQKVYDKRYELYLGLPLLDSFESAKEYPLQDNTKGYLDGLKKLNRVVRNLRG